MENSNNLNRTCHTCGKKYRYCYSCPDQRGELYHVMFDCEECMIVFDTLCDYGQGKINAKQAYDKLKDKMPEDVSTYSYGCQKLWKQIKNELFSNKEARNNYSATSNNKNFNNSKNNKYANMKKNKK